jgi:hypothetical protein
VGDVVGQWERDGLFDEIGQRHCRKERGGARRTTPEEEVGGMRWRMRVKRTRRKRAAG